jgi:hypothetical protein
VLLSQLAEQLGANHLHARKGVGFAQE